MVSRELPTPLHYQLREWLRKQIDNGKFKSGKPLPAETELMEKFGLSRGTVRKAVEALVYEGSLHRFSGKGTFVKEARDKPITLNVVVPSPNIFKKDFNPTNWELDVDTLNGILSGARSKNIAVKIIGYSPALLKKQNNSNGSIVLDVYEDLLKEFEDKNQPYVFIFELDRTPDFVRSGILVDFEDAFFKAPGYLAESGHKKIALIGRTDPIRLNGYKKALIKHELPFDETLIEPEWSGNMGDGYRAAEKLFSRRKDMDAIFCTTDLRAIGVLRFLKEKGIRVPQDISLLGFDNIRLSAEQEPPLTTFETPRFKNGEKALEEIVKWINGGNYRPKRLIRKGSIVVRESTRRR